ncbi:MAG: hypothetical protein KDK99_19000 [Verrucomicrobiales bacterium]|nr:hypothetical protein [Verrucomicrobiales bacterium]
MPSGNIIRDTPGLLLLIWGGLMSSLVLLSWRIHLRASEYDWLEFPTALGDRAYYDPGPTGDVEGLVRNGSAQPLGENDFFEANLVFEKEGERLALYRRLHRPTHRDDARMLKVARDQTGRFHVYQKAEAGTRQRQASGPYYLKAAEDAFIEFGEKKFYPPFEPSAVPAGGSG